ncbi:hypothetical protein HDU98_010910 [Podochytrium sp. JEL0797]|nr:hypothetical protein HDU98_010910 [Podochytrium sp. JEL0797]
MSGLDHAEADEVEVATEYNPDSIADPAKYMRSVAVVGLYELWAYYLFYNGDNGGGPNNGFSSMPCMVGTGSALIPQVSFALIQIALMQLTVAIVLITLGGLGDYKLHGRTFLFWASCVSITLHFVFVFINPVTGSMPLAVALLFICQVTYKMSLFFYFSAFPRLAVHMPSVYEKIDGGCIIVGEVDDEIAMQRSHISMISTYWSNIRWALGSSFAHRVIYALNPNPDVGQIPFTYNANALVFGVYWLIFAIPYFILDKKRPGPEIPEGVNVYTQAYEAFILAKKLPQAWWYIIGLLLFCDGSNSSGLILGNYLHGLYIRYNVRQNNLFYLAQAISSMIGCIAFWKIQQHFKIQTKTIILQVSNLLTMLMYAWAIVMELAEAKAWFAQMHADLGKTGLPLPYIHAGIKSGLVPIAMDAIAWNYSSANHKGAVECLQDSGLVEAEEMARRAASVRTRKSETDDENGPASLMDHANSTLQVRLQALFESHGLPSSVLKSLQTGESALADAEMQGLVMGPELHRAYQSEISKWVAEFPEAKKRFGVFEMVRNAKVDTIVGKLHVLCVKSLANGTSGSPVVAVVERKLVGSVMDQFAAKH